MPALGESMIAAFIFRESGKGRKGRNSVQYLFTSRCRSSCHNVHIKRETVDLRQVEKKACSTLEYEG